MISLHIFSEIAESISSGNPKLMNQMNQGSGEMWSSGVGMLTGGGSGGTGGQPTINVTIVVSDKSKLAANTKRRYEAQVNGWR